MQPEEPHVADSTALSIDQFASLLDADDARAMEVEKRDREDPAGGRFEPEEAGEPESEAISGDEQTYGEEPGPDEAQAIEAPRSWNADARARFAELPRDVQEVISARESERETALSKSQQDAAEHRKRADAEVSKIGHYKTVLDQLLPHFAETAQNRWGDLNLTGLAEKFGADTAKQVDHLFQQDLGLTQQLSTAQHMVREVEKRRFIAAESEQLKAVEPELADAKEGPRRRRAVGEFLAGHGIPESYLSKISAVELAIAYDALRYRQARESLAQHKNPANAALVTRPAPRPSAARPVYAPQKQKVAQARERLVRSGRLDDFVALLDAEGN